MKLKFKFWELFLLGSASVFFAVSAYFYFTEIPLRVLLFGMKAQGSSRKMGEVSSLNGSLKRKAQDRQDFQSLKSKGELYDSDTIVTGPESIAQISLDDGGVIDLGPQTMIRLVFSAYVSFDGISRSTGVELVTGQVKGAAKNREIVIKTTTGETIKIEKDTAPRAIAVAQPLPGKAPAMKVISDIIVARPSPSPTPSASPKPSPSLRPSPSPSVSPSASPSPRPSSSGVYAGMVSVPDASKVLKLPPGAPQPILELPFVFKLSSNKIAIRLQLRKEGKTLLDQPMTVSNDGRSSLRVRLDQPGDFEWGLIGTHPKTKRATQLFRGKFSVSSEYRAMYAPEVMISGKRIVSTRSFLKDQKFSLDLRWKPYPSAREYWIRIYRSDKESKPWIEEKVSRVTEWHKAMKEPFYGSVAVKLSAVTEKGFVVTAQPVLARYDFAAPVVVEPGPVFRLDTKKIQESGIKILCSWSRTEFTQSYDFEIATDDRFEKVVLKKSVGDNFFIITKIASGKYWWRIRSVGKGIVSPYTEPRVILVGD